MDVSKLKVTELRTMLSGRSLDTKGTKSELVKRLNDSFTNDPQEADEPESEAMEDDQGTLRTDEPTKQDSIVEATVGLPDVVESPKQDSSLEATADVVENSPAKKELNASKPISHTALEDEPLIEDEVHCLDWYDSDLSLKIDKNNMMTGVPLIMDGWEYVWSGARSSRGFVTGKVWYEVKIIEGKINNSLNEIRVGWSTNDTELLLGRVSTSFGYCSKAGKKRCNNQFLDYGEPMNKGDVIGAFLDMNSSIVSMAFTLNGKPQGEAFSVPKELLKEKGLFPHISTKNFTYEVNFGKNIVSKVISEKPNHYSIEASDSAKDHWFSPLEGYCSAAYEESIPNRSRIVKRQQCETIMMIGLPGCGKTSWAENWMKKYPEKRYNSIGLHTLMDRMEVDGEPIMKMIPGNKWNRLVTNLSECLNKWIKLAAQRRRNFIFDQVNISPVSHSKGSGNRIVSFLDMYLRAVVIVPSDTEYKSRLESQKKVAEQSKDRYISSEAQIMRMKSIFTLPSDGDDSPFNEITFVELNRDEAAKLIEEYNKDAKEKGYDKKFSRPRNNFRNRSGRVSTPQFSRGSRNGRSFIDKNISETMMNSLSKESLMKQASLIQNTVIQNGWLGSPMRGAQSIMANSSTMGMFDQNLPQGLFANQIPQPQLNQFFGGGVGHMFRGGYNGSGMNAKRF